MAVNLFRPPARLSIPSLTGGALEIDPFHPMANGLIGCWLPGLMGGIDLTSSTPDLTPNSAMVRGTTVEGPGDDCSANASNQGWGGLAPPAIKGGATRSLYWRGNIVAAGSGFNALFGCSYDNAGSTPFAVALIGAGSSGWNGASGSYVPQWNQGGTNTSISCATGVGVGFHSLGLTLDANVTAFAYIDGVQDANNNPSGFPPNFTATSTLGVDFYSSAPTRFTGAITMMCCWWNRFLSANEMALMHTNPYDFLLPAEGEWPMMLPPSIPMMGQIWI